MYLKLEAKLALTQKKINKAVYTAAPVSGGWAGALLSWAGALMSWAGALISWVGAVKAVHILKVKV